MPVWIKAMIYAVEELVNPQLPASSKLGYEIVDDCYGIDLAMEASVRFMMGDTTKKRRDWIKAYKERRADNQREQCKLTALNSHQLVVNLLKRELKGEETLTLVLTLSMQSDSSSK